MMLFNNWMLIGFVVNFGAKCNLFPVSLNDYDDERIAIGKILLLAEEINFECEIFSEISFDFHELFVV